MRVHPSRQLTIKQFAAETRQRAGREWAGTPARLSVTPIPAWAREVRKHRRTYREGALAGLLGASAVAFWFFLLDLLQGRPLYTPSIFGEALFRNANESLIAGDFPVSIQMVTLFSCVHAIIFAAVGSAAARVLAGAGRQPHVGLGILFLFVALEIGFLVPTMLVAREILQVLPWPTVLIANLLAAAVVGIYLWRRLPKLRGEL